MDPKFLRNQRFAKKFNKRTKKSVARAKKVSLVSVYVVRNSSPGSLHSTLSIWRPEYD